mmetsp:Transcript_18637/g.58107  ORF Transcript_18637/g.58107 Transcript_18637/m.58107 type:complete len:273 (+) Transcript_18637:53-871(+)
MTDEKTTGCGDIWDSSEASAPRRSREIASALPRRATRACSGFRRSARRELFEHERRSHHAAAGEEGLRDEPRARMLAVRGGEQLGKADVDHHARAHREHGAKRRLRRTRVDKEVREEGTARLRHPRQRTPKDGLGATARAMEDGHRDREPFRDVVDCDRNRERRARPDRVVRGHVRRHALRQVVQRDRDAEHGAHHEHVGLARREHALDRERLFVRLVPRVGRAQLELRRVRVRRVIVRNVPPPLLAVRYQCLEEQVDDVVGERHDHGANEE